MTVLTVNGLELHLQRLAAQGRTEGEPRETAVLIHGMLTDSLASYFFTLGPAFAAAGIDVIMYDHRGHGKSERPASGYQLENVVADLDALLREIHDGGPVHLVGNSYGGTIGLTFATEFPERVASVSIVESEPATEAWAEKMRGNLIRAKNDLGQKGAITWVAAQRGVQTARLAKKALKMLTETQIWADIPESRTYADEQVRAITAPVLSIYGSESDLAVQAPWLESLIVDCRTVIVPEQEHSVLVERPKLVEELVLAWIQEHPAVVTAES